MNPHRWREGERGAANAFTCSVTCLGRLGPFAISLGLARRRRGAPDGARPPASRGGAKRRLCAAKNAGSQAFAASMRSMPLSRISLTSRTYSVRFARSIRPFGLRRARVGRLDVQRRERPRELRGRALAALPVHAKHAVAARAPRHRPAVRGEVPAQRLHARHPRRALRGAPTRQQLHGAWACQAAAGYGYLRRLE